MIALLALVLSAPAQDLVIDGETEVMSGSHTFRTVLITNSGILRIADWDGSTGGRLEIEAEAIIIDSSSSIRGIGAGYRPANPTGEGPGPGEFGSDAGGGGAYGGIGGRGVMSDGVSADAFGGTAYGVPGLDDLDMGSPGGGSASGAFGGEGGASVVLRAAFIDIDGFIRVNGVPGTDAGGGGAGGSIALIADELRCAGALDANGGDGGTRGSAKGGGGGGGIVMQLHDRPSNPCSNAEASGGAGLGTWSDGDPGIATIGEVDFDGDGYGWYDGDCEPSVATAFPGQPEVCNGIDDNCDGVVDEECVVIDPDNPDSFGRPQFGIESGGGLTCSQAPGSRWWAALGVALVFTRRRRAVPTAR